MRKSVFILLCSVMIFSCTTKNSVNPFFEEFQTDYGVPPFDKIEMEHYEPAFTKGMEEEYDNIKAIVKNPEAPTFDNVIGAMDNSSPILDRVSGVFFNMTSAENTPELNELYIKLSPKLSEHGDNIYLNADLFQKIKTVYEQKDSENLTTEQLTLLDRTYKNFVRRGANLNEEDQVRLREINKELSLLGIQFSNNILKGDGEYQLVVDNKEDLSGLSADFITSAAHEATDAGLEGKWVLKLKNTSRLPVLQYADNRALREELYTAYINRGNNDDSFDNKEILSKVVTLRLEKANLLGFDCYANFVLDTNMAKTSEAVMDFLNNLWSYALPKAKAEAQELQKLMDKEGKGEKLEPWDWWYYTEKLRKEKYDLDEEEIKPYFKLENVRDGAFMVANKLYGLTFKQLENIPTYHPEVQVFEVNDADGSLIGLFYADYFPREGKKFGAWMSDYRGQKGEIRPLICNVCNLSRPVGDAPSLLTLEEVETVFHEFGHALHGLLSQCNYEAISGTSVARDFVELPSQINEHWAMEPEVLKAYAKHYETGEVIPDALIEKINRQSTFNEGFITTELLAASILDMELHNLTEIKDFDILDFEKVAMDKVGLIPEIAPRYRSTYFNHIIGGYAAGYYSYSWANVLDNDAFEAFKENGIFDQKTARLFRTQILEKGGSDDPMTLYVNFRGAEPKLDAMLRNRGLID